MEQTSPVDITMLPLPEVLSPQVSIALTRLPAGGLHLPTNLFVAGADSDSNPLCPSMSWLISHGPSNRNVLFDLGMRKDIQNHTPAVYKRLQTVIKPSVTEDVFESLSERGLNPLTDIDTVIFSHLHYDHTGDPSCLGPSTKFVVGPGALALIEGDVGYPQKENAHYDSRLLPRERCTELPPPDDRGFWQALGPFPDAHDYFGDSSLFIVNAPGHAEGHINLLVRTAINAWAFLAGDTAHDIRLLREGFAVAVYPDPEGCGVRCAHKDKAAAEIHIERVKKLGEYGNVEIILAHDSVWLAANQKRFGG